MPIAPGARAQGCVPRGACSGVRVRAITVASAGMTPSAVRVGANRRPARSGRGAATHWAGPWSPHRRCPFPGCRRPPTRGAGASAPAVPPWRRSAIGLLSPDVLGDHQSATYRSRPDAPGSWPRCGASHGTLLTITGNQPESFRRFRERAGQTSGLQPGVFRSIRRATPVDQIDRGDPGAGTARGSRRGCPTGGETVASMPSSQSRSSAGAPISAREVSCPGTERSRPVKDGVVQIEEEEGTGAPYVMHRYGQQYR